MLREEIRMHVTQHAEMIALLALIGREQGYDVWIGRNEQGHTAGGLAPSKPLSQLVTTRPTHLKDVTNLRSVLDMDLLWLKNDKVIRAFEVEATTTMTSGLLRGSNLPAATPKVMVLPEQRQADHQRKMQSPLFREHFEKESWTLLYFGALRQAYSRKREAMDVAALYNQPSKRTEWCVRESKQEELNLKD
jgi:hypothetical protein